MSSSVKLVSLKQQDLLGLKSHAVSALKLITEGYTLTAACSRSKIPVRVFQAFIDCSPGFSEAYEKAKLIGHDALADALLNIRDHPIYGSRDTREQKNISDNIKWFLSRKDRPRYGDKDQVNPQTNADKVIDRGLRRARKQQRAILEGSVEDKGDKRGG